MRFLVKIGLGFLAFLLVIYLAIAAYLYTRQDGMIFPGNRLAANYHFKYTYPYTEYKIKNGKSILSGLLFKAQKPKGLIFYLHGNSNNLKTWGDIAPAYTALNYDLFILDYPGYGKSTGRINNEAQLLKAVQVAFDSLKTAYKPQDIVIMGYSIGTGPAAWLAGRRPNKALVLLAPYYSLTELIHSRYPFMPAGLAKYHLKT
jgi:pimeloyl-ACP methyl ester carboxylesterase